MHSTKLLTLLQTLEKEERKRFNQFIQSPYFNTNDTLLAFWQYLNKYSPSFSSKKLTVKNILEAGLPIKTEKSLEQQKWKLVKLIEHFLAIEQFQQDEHAKPKRVNTAFYEKDLYEWFTDATKANIKLIEKQAKVNEKDYLALNQLHHDLYFNQNSKKYKPTPPNLAKSDDYLEHYYWLSKLKYVCEWTCRATRHKEDIPANILGFKIPIRFLQSNYVLFILYHNIYDLFKPPINYNSVQLFEKTIQLFKENITSIPSNDQLMLLSYLLNYGIAGTRTNEQSYLDYVYRLYDLGIQEKILFWKDQLQIEVIINIVHIGGKLKKFKWAEKILAEHKESIAIKNSTTFYVYAQSNLDFYKGKYFEVVAQLENLKFDHWGMEVARRSLQLRSSFECFLQKKSYERLVENKAKNFKQFLNRKDNVSMAKAKAYLNLIDAIQKAVLLLIAPTNPQAVQRLIEDIVKKKTFMERNWLVEHLQKT